ncbi:MAG: succinylglutamate desuccinylase/aspartoacylase family protein [bacterium]
MEEDAIELVGQENGSISLIMVGIHGDEACGINALESILPSLSVRRGKVLFVYGNPRAIAKSVRFTEKNLNRMFKAEKLLSIEEKGSYEYQRAEFLKKYLDQADALLDIHASHTPDSKPFIICESSAREIIGHLPLDLVVSGFDKLEPGGSDSYMNNQGKIGICVECGYLGDSKSIMVAEETIMAFLKARGHIDGKLDTITQEFVQMCSIYITKTNDFKLTKKFSDFEQVAAGRIIGTDGELPVTVNENSIILFARNRQKIGEEAFLVGKYKKSLM